MRTSAIGITIEKATKADAASIALVLRQAFAEFEPLYTKQAFAVTIAGISGVLERMRDGPVWVVIHDRRRVGTASAVQRDTGVYARGMAVIPEARGLGVGRLLLDEIESYARSCRAERLYLSTTPFLMSAIRLYQQFGFHRTDERLHELFGTPLFTMEKLLAKQPPSHSC